jgi:hypothetical protein
LSRGPLKAVADGVQVAVRLSPRASRNAVAGLADTADGGTVLKVSVTAVPEGGRANAALVGLLAKAWRVPPSSVRVASGATDRNKLLHVAGVPADLESRLNAWLAALGQGEKDS